MGNKKIKRLAAIVILLVFMIFTDMTKLLALENTVNVILYFNKYGHENPKGDKEPNWFYYWKQTPAGISGTAELRFDPACGEKEYGYYIRKLPPEPIIYICTLAASSFREDARAIGAGYCNGRETEADFVDGIDRFGTIVIHEFQHFLVHLEFLTQCSGDVIKDYISGCDRDRDGLSINQELADGTRTDDPDTDGDGQNDNEERSYCAEFNWTIGIADCEDWSDTGANYNSPSGILPGCGN